MATLYYEKDARPELVGRQDGGRASATDPRATPTRCNLHESGVDVRRRTARRTPRSVAKAEAAGLRGALHRGGGGSRLTSS
jgi:hypothetical protein